MAEAPEGPHSPLQRMLLRNLRGFRDTGVIEFAPITFVFGKNSSGKTTLLRAPLLFRQLLLAQSITGEVPLSGPYADFGSYREAVHGGDRSKDIDLEFDFDLTDRIRLYAGQREFERYQSYTSTRVKVRLHWNVTRGHSQFSHIKFVDLDDNPMLSFTRLGPDRIKTELYEYNFTQTFTGMPELSFQSLQFVGQPREVTQETRDLSFVSFILFDSLRDAVGRVRHIGPLRDMPERAYRTDRLAVPGGATQSTLGLMSAETASIRAASSALKRLGIAERVEITHPAPGYAGITVTDVNTGRKDNLADVGFGISQVLPIIIRVATAPRGSLLLIEQPELHLHPETQATLAEVLIDLAYRRGAPLFIESHSENMLLRLRRLVAEKKLQAEDVAIYVTDRGKVRPAKLSQSGDLDMRAFPKDFFEDEWLEAIQIARASRTKSSV
jgi:hypothetical protein